MYLARAYQRSCHYKSAEHVEQAWCFYNNERSPKLKGLLYYSRVSNKSAALNKSVDWGKGEQLNKSDYFFLQISMSLRKIGWKNNHADALI